MADWTDVTDEMQIEEYLEREASTGAKEEDLNVTPSETLEKLCHKSTKEILEDIAELTGTDNKNVETTDAYVEPPIETRILELVTEIKRKRGSEEEEEYAREIALLNDSVLEILTEEAQVYYEGGVQKYSDFFTTDTQDEFKKYGYSEFYEHTSGPYDVICGYAVYPTGEKVLHFEKTFYGEIFSPKAQEYARKRLGLSIETYDDDEMRKTVIKRDFYI